MNSLNVLNENGLIILHDLNPLLEKYQVTPEPPGGNMIWNGDCWKAAIAIRLLDDIEIVVGDFDQGVGILRRKPNQHPLPREWANKLLEYMSMNTDSNSFLNGISFTEFRENREVLYRLMTVAEIRYWLEQ